MNKNKKYILLLLAIFSLTIGCSGKKVDDNGAAQTQKTDEQLLQELRERFQPTPTDPPMVSGPITTLSINCRDGFTRTYQNFSVQFNIDNNSFVFGEGADVFVIRHPAFTATSTAFVGDLGVTDYASLDPVTPGPLFAATITGLTVTSTSVYSLILSELAASMNWVYAEMHITTTEHGECQIDLSGQFSQIIS